MKKTSIGIILLSMLCGLQATAQTVLLASASYISGDGSGIQNWDDGVTITTTNLDGTSGRLAYETQFSDHGFGVAGGRWDQIDFYEEGGNRSESFNIDFNGPVNNVILTVGMMGLGEGPGSENDDETGLWKGYDQSGNLVAEGLLGPELSTLGANVKYSGTYGKYPIALASSVPLYSVSIEATGFGHGLGESEQRSYGENNSDFNIMELSYERASTTGNNAPVAQDDDYFEIREDIGPTGIQYSTLLANDSDPDGDAIRITGFDFSGFPGVIEDLPADEEILFTTEENFSGEITFTYTITDGELSDVATITITVLNVLDPPTVVQDGPFTTELDEPLSISVGQLLANDFDPDGDDIEIESVSDAVNGTVELSGDEVVFTPAAGFIGEASFIYTVRSVGSFSSSTSSEPIIVDVVSASASVEGTYILVPKSDENTYLQVSGLSNRTSAVVQGCSTYQTWSISQRDNGFYKILVDGTTQALEAWQSTPRNGDDVTIYDSNNRDWQQWEFISTGDGYYQIKGKYNPRFITVSGGNATVQNETGLSNQLWKLVDPDGFVCNNNPVGGFDEFETFEGDTLYIPFSVLLANDSDPDGDPITITDVPEVRLGAVEIVGDSVQFIGLGGPALFVYVLSDGRGGSDRVTVSVNVLGRPDNFPPVAEDDDFFEIREDIGPTGIQYSTLLANDSDPDGDALSILGFDFIGFPGEIQDLSDDEEILFTTEKDFFGEITFTYTISDGQLTDVGEITINVLNVLDPPTIVQDGPFTTQVNESATIAISELLANDFDADGDDISFGSVSDPINGTVTVSGDNVVFTPDTDFVGEASFVYSITTAGSSSSSSATSEPIIIDVLDVAEAITGAFVLVPKADEDTYLQVNGIKNGTSAIVEGCDATGFVWVITERDNGFYKIINETADKALEAWKRTPSNGDDVTIYSSNDRDWQQWEILDAGDGYYRIKGKYNPRFLTLSNGNAVVLDDNGSDSQLWKLEAFENTVCFNNPPIAVDDDPLFNGSIQSGRTGFTFGVNNLLSNDSDPDADPLEVISVGNFNHVSVEITSTTVLTMATEADYSGPASFTYTISDGKGGTAQAEARLIITNQSPVANNDSGFTIIDGGPFYIPFTELLANDFDPDGDSIFVVDVVDPQNGTVGLLSQDVIFIPAGLGFASFAYSISDGTGKFATASVVLEVVSSQARFEEGTQSDIAHGVMIYPNPVADLMVIERTQSEKFSTIRIYDSTGKLVINNQISENISRLELDLSELGSGLYYLQLGDNDRLKFIKE